MKQTRVATRYAKALFDFSIEENLLEKVYEDMILVLKVCDSNKDFKQMLFSPIIKTKKKQSIVKEIFGKHIDEISLIFIFIIIKKRREIHIEQISNQFIKIYKNYHGIKTALIKTAVEIDDNIRKIIVEKLEDFTKSQIELIEEIKKELIGGFVLNIEDKQYDASIKNRIKKLSKEFEMNIYEKGF